MKKLHSIALAMFVAALVASAPAEAQRRGHFGGGPRIGFSIGFGAPFYPYRPPYYYYPPYYAPYYYPPAVVVPPAPPVYIERQDLIQEEFQGQPQYSLPQAQQPQYQQPPVPNQNPNQAPPQPQAQANVPPADWFYCPDSKTYYPYVQQCAGEWQRVTPHPPPR